MHPTFIRLACKNKTEYLEYSKLYIKPTAKKTTKYNENELNMKKKNKTFSKHTYTYEYTIKTEAL
jgi:hypothetical protein